MTLHQGPTRWGPWPWAPPPQDRVSGSHSGLVVSTPLPHRTWALAPCLVTSLSWNTSRELADQGAAGELVSSGAAEGGHTEPTDMWVLSVTPWSEQVITIIVTVSGSFQSGAALRTDPRCGPGTGWDGRGGCCGLNSAASWLCFLVRDPLSVLRRSRPVTGRFPLLLSGHLLVSGLQWAPYDVLCVDIEFFPPGFAELHEHVG